MILAVHRLLRHFLLIEQIMNSLLGIFVNTLVAPNACIGRAKWDHYPTEPTHSAKLDCSRIGTKCEARESRRRRYFAILPGQQMVVCMIAHAQTGSVKHSRVSNLLASKF
jgi:hypothetical protein